MKYDLKGHPNSTFISYRIHHCWNESWMVRKDLNQSGGDWQYLNPTPLETSKGKLSIQSEDS